MGKSQPFAPSFSASPRRNLYSSSFSRVDQEADQRRCSAPRMFSSSQAQTSFLNSTMWGGSADTLKSIKFSFQASENLPSASLRSTDSLQRTTRVRLHSSIFARLAYGIFDWPA